MTDLITTPKNYLPMSGLLNDVIAGRHNDLAWFMFINNDLS